MLVEAHQASVLLVLLVTGAAALFDLKTGLIPNRLLVWGSALVLLSKVAVESVLAGQAPLSVLFTALAGVAACAVVPALLYVRGGLGGGDLKLLALVGAAMGPLMGVEVEMYAFCLGSTFALLYLAYRGLLLRSLASSVSALLPRFARTRESAGEPAQALQFRFGPAIFAGALLSAARALVLS